MDRPLTPREKVEQAVKDAIREDASVGLQMTLTPRFMRGLVDRVLAATSVVDHETGFVSDKSSALASGSGDHAELARLADDLRKFEHHAVGSLKIDMTEVRRIIAACDAHAALLAENAALREDRDQWRNWYRKASVEINAQDDRATEAERKLAEEEARLERWEPKPFCHPSVSSGTSKEAERG